MNNNTEFNGTTQPLVNVLTGDVRDYYVQPTLPEGTAHAWRTTELTVHGVPDRRVRPAMVGVRRVAYKDPITGCRAHTGRLAPVVEAREVRARELRERLRQLRLDLARVESDLFELYVDTDANP